MSKINFGIVILFVAIIQTGVAQRKLLVETKIKATTLHDNIVTQSGCIVFTGSSTIARWGNLPAYFPFANITNNGIGSSEMSDVLDFVNELVIKYSPSRVFIYEGDNDVASGKQAKEILEDATRIVNKIHSSNPNTQIYFLTAKPSPSRWHLKEKYVYYNRALTHWALGLNKVEVIDVWQDMLDSSGKVRQDLFKKDQLHLNEKGYQIWADCLREFVY